MKEMTKQLFRNFVLIYGFTMMATLLFCRITGMDVVFELDYFQNILFFSLAADLTSLICISSRKMSKREVWIRTVLHTVVLAVVLMAMGHYIGMWEGALAGVLFFVLIIVVDVLVRFLSYSEDVADAAAINESIRRRRRGDE